jgi:hypothetical protein
VPIAWCWIKNKKGKGRGPNEWQLALLRQVYALLLNNLPVHTTNCLGICPRQFVD